MKNIQDIMSKDSITVNLQDNLYEIAVKMKENDIGFIPVLDDEKLIGVVTDRDLVIRGYAERHSGSTSVEEVMTKNVITISSQASVDEAAKIMSVKKIRRLPVVENERLVGIVALGDLAVRHMYEDEAGQALSEISEPVVTH